MLSRPSPRPTVLTTRQAPYAASKQAALCASLLLAALATACGGGGGGGGNPPPPQNQSPTAAIAASTVLGNAPFAVEFNAAGSSDPDGTVARFQWDFDGDSFIDLDTAIPNATHMYTQPGAVTATLQVVDNGGAADTATVTITVGNPNTSTVTVDADLGVADTQADVHLVAGNPAVLYVAANGFLRYSRSADALGSDWPQPVGIPIGPCENPDLDVVAGNPAVTFITGANHELRFARAQDAEGLNWQGTTPIVFPRTAEANPAPPRLLVADGLPAIVFELVTDVISPKSVVIIHALDALGETWSDEAVPIDLQAGLGAATGAALVGGIPAVVYEKGGRIQYKRALDTAGRNWPESAVDLGAAGDQDAELTLLIIEGRPAVFFKRSRDLVLVRGADPSGDAWQAQQVILDGAEHDPARAVMAVVGGFPMAVYLEQQSGNLDLLAGSESAGSAFEPSLDLALGNSTDAVLLDLFGRPGLFLTDGTSLELLFARL